METSNRKSRIWGLEPHYDPGRVIPIYEAIRELEIESIVDVACGVGLIAESLSWVMNADIEQFDIEEYPEWGSLRVRPQKKNLYDFIKEDKPYDLVLFLNSYRNWEGTERNRFNSWLKRNAKYFITSGQDGPGIGKAIGMDVKGYTLYFYEL